MQYLCALFTSLGRVESPFRPAICLSEDHVLTRYIWNYDYIHPIFRCKHVLVYKPDTHSGPDSAQYSHLVQRVAFDTETYFGIPQKPTQTL